MPNEKSVFEPYTAPLSCSLSLFCQRNLRQCARLHEGELFPKSSSNVGGFDSLSEGPSSLQYSSPHEVLHHVPEDITSLSAFQLTSLSSQLGGVVDSSALMTLNNSSVKTRGTSGKDATTTSVLSRKAPKRHASNSSSNRSCLATAGGTERDSQLPCGISVSGERTDASSSIKQTFTHSSTSACGVRIMNDDDEGDDAEADHASNKAYHRSSDGQETTLRMKVCEPVSSNDTSPDCCPPPADSAFTPHKHEKELHKNRRHIRDVGCPPHCRLTPPPSAVLARPPADNDESHTEKVLFPVYSPGESARTGETFCLSQYMVAHTPHKPRNDGRLAVTRNLSSQRGDPLHMRNTVDDGKAMWTLENKGSCAVGTQHDHREQTHDDHQSEYRVLREAVSSSSLSHFQPSMTQLPSPVSGTPHRLPGQLSREDDPPFFYATHQDWLAASYVSMCPTPSKEPCTINAGSEERVSDDAALLTGFPSPVKLSPIPTKTYGVATVLRRQQQYCGGSSITSTHHRSPSALQPSAAASPIKDKNTTPRKASGESGLREALEVPAPPAVMNRNDSLRATFKCEIYSTQTPPREPGPNFQTTIWPTNLSAAGARPAAATPSPRPQQEQKQQHLHCGSSVTNSTTATSACAENMNTATTLNSRSVTAIYPFGLSGTVINSSLLHTSHMEGGSSIFLATQSVKQCSTSNTVTPASAAMAKTTSSSSSSSSTALNPAVTPVTVEKGGVLNSEEAHRSSLATPMVSDIQMPSASCHYNTSSSIVLGTALASTNQLPGHVATDKQQSMTTINTSNPASQQYITAKPIPGMLTMAAHTPQPPCYSNTGRNSRNSDDAAGGRPVQQHCRSHVLMAPTPDERARFRDPMSGMIPTTEEAHGQRPSDAAPPGISSSTREVHRGTAVTETLCYRALFSSLPAPDRRASLDVSSAHALQEHRKRYHRSAECHRSHHNDVASGKLVSSAAPVAPASPLPRKPTRSAPMSMDACIPSDLLRPWRPTTGTSSTHALDSWL